MFSDYHLALGLALVLKTNKRMWLAMRDKESQLTIVTLANGSKDKQGLIVNSSFSLLCSELVEVSVLLETSVLLEASFLLM